MVIWSDSDQKTGFFGSKINIMAKQNILLAISFFLTINLFSQSKSVVNSEAITKILYQHVNDDTPGMAMGIVQNGKIVYEQYIGYANLEHEINIDQDTRFNIASNAKQFTALCILALIEEGKLSLDDDVRKYLPDLYPNIPDKITISHLLTHTSGIRDYCDLLALKGKTWWKQFIDNEDAIELLQAQKDLNCKPGTEWIYSNSNYILLAEMVKQVTGQDFSEFAQTMFEELGMPNTDFLTNYMAVIPNKARPYGNWGGWREIPVITEVHGDGALFTTLRDQLTWEQIIQANDGTYFSQKLIDESQSPLESSINNDYGYGLEFDVYGGLNRRFHNGATGGYRATFLRFPSKQLSLVMMTNNRGVPIDHVVWQIVKLVFDLQEETDHIVYPGNPETIEPLQDIQDVLGIYKGVGEDGTIIRIVEKEGSLYREIYQRDPDRLHQEQGGLFEYERIKGLKMNFSNIGQTDQQFTLYMSSQAPGTYKKLSDLDMNRFDKEGLNGRYYNDETDTEIILTFVEGNTYSLIKNGRERQAKLILEDYLRMMDSYEIRVIRDKEGQVIGLNVKMDRIQNVIFKRT